MKVGLIGCGTIGSAIATAIDEGRGGETGLTIIYDIEGEKAPKLAKALANKPMIAEHFEELIEREEISLVIEAANQSAVRQYAARVLEAGKDLMLMSTGALVDGELFGEIKYRAEKGDRKVYVPSGAIAGLDGIKSASVARIDEVVLTTTKPPKGLEGAPYIVEHKIDLYDSNDAKIVYRGSATEACKHFPKNVNVAAALSLAGIGSEETEIQVVSDPNIERNIHEIRVRGEFGKLTIRAENYPSPDNPKTSYLAVLSAIATLKKITAHVIVGT